MLIIYCDQKGTLHRVLGKGFTVLPSGVGAVATVTTASTLGRGKKKKKLEKMTLERKDC